MLMTGRVEEGISIPCVCDGQVLCCRKGWCNPASFKKPCKLRGFPRFPAERTVARVKNPADGNRRKPRRYPCFRGFCRGGGRSRRVFAVIKRPRRALQKPRERRSNFPTESQKNRKSRSKDERIGRLHWRSERTRAARTTLLPSRHRPPNRRFPDPFQPQRSRRTKAAARPHGSATSPG